jgi:hypothetical protein
MRWQYRDPLLVWLCVAAYAAHVVEEWLGGFPEWVTIVVGQSLPRVAFVIINAVALALGIAAARAATQRDSSGWMAIAMGTILLVNGVAHILGSVATGTYSPGLFTGVILYLPLGQIVLLRAWQQAPASFARGVIVGLGLHALVALVALAVARAT